MMSGEGFSLMRRLPYAARYADWALGMLSSVTLSPYDARTTE
jgi:hypothetical protein